MQRWTRTLRQTPLPGLAMLVIALCAAGPAHAGLVTVTSALDDDVGCTLRKAIATTNTGTPAAGCTESPGTNEIRFTGAQAIVLNAAKGPLVIQRSVTLTGQGKANTSISGGGTSKSGIRVFDIPTGSGINLTLAGLTVVNGNAAPDAVQGDGLSSGGALFIASGASVSLSNCAFTNNYAKSSGGAIENRGTLDISNCTFNGNEARGEGGVIRNIGLLTVNGSTFSTNKAERGGAIWISHPSATITINSSSFNGNTGSSNGGVTAYGGALMNADESGATLVLGSNSDGGSNDAGGNGNVVWEGNPMVKVLPTTPIMAGASAPLSVEVRGPFYAATGTVGLRTGLAAIAGCGPLSLTGQGDASCSAAGLPLGVHTISADYSGDSNHAGGFSTGVAQVVNGYTNQNATQVKVTGPANATVWMDSANVGTLDAQGTLITTVNTPAPDGNKSFAIQTRADATVLTNSTLSITRDSTQPAWSGLQPANSGYLKNGGMLDYQLSENVASASITFTRTGGSADLATHTCTLQGSALLSGAHSIALGTGVNGCNANTALVEGAIYTLTFVATDAAGNVSATTTTTGVTYDTQAPAFSALAPASGGALKLGSTLGFALSEAVANARITATRTSGSADAGSPRTCTLQGTALNAGARQMALTTDANGCAAALNLVDGAVYTFAFDASDPAGNVAATAQVTAITYDTTPPTAQLGLPSYSTVRNVPIGAAFTGTDTGSGIATDGYCLLDTNVVGNCTWGAQPAGFAFTSDGLKTLYGFVRDKAGNVSAVASASITVDTGVPVAPTLTTTPAYAVGNSTQVEVRGEVGARIFVNGVDTGQTVGAGGKTTITLNTSAMAEGQRQTFQITLSDAAGNTSTALSVELTRDGTAPVFSAIAPATNGAIKADSKLGFALSEAAATARITATRTGGTADAASPHTCTLQGTALAAGAHEVNLGADANGCAAALNLVDGAVYTLAFDATDVAGNSAATAQATGISYDTTLPQAQLSLPSYSTVRNVPIGAAFTGTDTGSGIATDGYCLLDTNVVGNCTWGAQPAGFAFTSDGLKTLYGFVRDKAGNVSAVASASITVDTGVPVAPTLTTTPAYAVGNSTQVEVRGEVGARIFVNGADTGLSIDGTGKVSITLNTAGIANGQHQVFNIDLRDAAGNISAVLPLDLARDTTAPVFSATTPASNGAIRAGSTLGFTLSKAVASARITATRTGGTADGASPHTCNLQGTALSAGAHVVALTADANGCTAPLGLQDGAVYTFAFDAIDAASNAAAPVSVTGVAYDTSAPPAPVVSSPANNASGEGASLAIVGTAEAGSRVDVYEGATLLGSGTATGGNFSVTVSGLAFAAHNFTLKATDTAGNESASSPVLTYTAQVPSSGGPSTPGPVVTQGSVTVTPTTPVTVGGSVQVTAAPGSTITLSPQSGGSTITLPPAGNGGAPAPLTLVIGGQTFSIQPQPDTATVLSVVTLTGANGQPQVALVLNPSTSGDSQVTLSGTVSQGTVVALLSTSTGNLPLTALGDGAVSVTLVTTPRAAAGTPQSWSVFVRTGRVALPPAANGAAAVTVYSGEMARLDGTGKVQSVRLGTVAGNGLGDPVQRADLPVGINASVGFVRLAGVPTRTGGSTPLETLVNAGLRTVGITSSAQSTDGSITWNLGGTNFPVVPLEVRVAPGRADGVSVADDGSIEVTTAGLVTRFGPTLQSLPAMGQALTALGATTVMQPNGALRVSLGSTVFHLRAQWLPMGRTGSVPGFVFSSTTGLIFTDAGGVSQALLGDVADYEGLTSLLQSLLGAGTVLRTGLDQQTELIAGGQRFQLVPDLALLPAGTGLAGGNWWFEGSKLFVRYPGGLVQGFAVTAR
jgi:stress response protein SCP2